ncbi:MAG: class I SAM-dependent methyltransferase, partial [Candidatus Ornithospirochaeta sp.]
LSRMKEGGTILDYGSGSGRDSAYFLDKGFSVDSLDGSAEMKAQAERLFGIKVKLSSFLSLEEKDKYDGIWAQASILHLEEHDLRVALTLIERALKRDGVFYSSFRKGEGDGYENGRWYTNMTERRFLSFLPASLYVEKIWESQDVRPGVSRTWLSIICRKKS